MAIIKDNDNLMGVDTTTYNRIANTGAMYNGRDKMQLAIQKFSSKEYREENPNDFKEIILDIELTDREKDQIWNILYTAMNRVIEGIDDI